MSVEANVVYTLSRVTGFGVEMCKMALERSKNDIDEARRLLEKWAGTKNIGTENKKFGAVCTYLEKTPQTSAAVVQVTCTDELFSKTREFYSLVGQVTTEIVQWGHPYVAEPEIEDLQTKNNFKIDIQSVRYEKTGAFSLLTTYSQRDQIGAIIETEVATQEAFDNKLFKLFSFDLAMHIVAFNPLSVSKANIPDDVKRSIQVDIERQLAKECKDMKFWAVAAEGKFNKWAEQRSLLNQIFIKSDKDSVDEIRKKIGEKIGSEITIKRFARLTVGS